MTEAELLALDTRRDLFQIRRAMSDMLRAGQPVDALYHALAEHDLVALTDLVVGPQALRGRGAVSAALSVLPRLESAVSPAGLYRRLLDVDPASAGLVLEAACARHPTGPWLIALSARVEGAEAGLTHLRASAELPSLPQTCQAHCRAGHVRGLVLFAGASGRLEPVLTLLTSGPIEAAAEAAVRAIEAAPGAPVVETLAAVWGPDLDPLLCRMLPHLRSAATARRFEPYAQCAPIFAQRYAVVRRALFR